eukprot:31215-Pelagococcus_subviridis.AAC.9
MVMRRRLREDGTRDAARHERVVVDVRRRRRVVFHERERPADAARAAQAAHRVRRAARTDARRLRSLRI